MITAIVLAAGESRRMGTTNKLLLPFGNQPLLAHIVRTVVQSEAEEVIVVLGHEAERVRETLVDDDLAVTYNARYQEGMTTSIQAGIRAASPTTTGYMICLSDLPLIESTEFNRLIRALREAMGRDPRHIVRPVYQGRPGNPVLFPAHYKGEILEHKEMKGCQRIVKDHAAFVLEVEMETDHVLRDLDTPEAYQALQPPVR